MSKNKHIKVCFLIPVLVAGGAERVLSEIINYFARNIDAELHLVLYGKKSELFYSIPFNTIIHQPEELFNDNSRWLSTIKRVFFVRKVIKSINPTTILSFGEYWNSFVLLALLGLHTPVFISDRSQPNKSFSKLHRFLRKKLYPNATGIIAQTQLAKDIYTKEFKHSNIIVIGNPIRYVSAIKKEYTQENIVLSVGRLISSKNYDQLIRMFVEIGNVDWKLVIVGGDALKQNNFNALNNLIKELNAETKIELEGTQKNIDKYYMKSKIFAFSSSSEGFPNAIGEAMSARLPVVAYDCIAGPSEMIEDGKNGYLIELFNDEEFKEKLSVLMLNDELRKNMGTIAEESIKKFSVQKIGKKYADFIMPLNS